MRGIAKTAKFLWIEVKLGISLAVIKIIGFLTGMVAAVNNSIVAGLDVVNLGFLFKPLANITNIINLLVSVAGWIVTAAMIGVAVIMFFTLIVKLLSKFGKKVGKDLKEAKEMSSEAVKETANSLKKAEDVNAF